MYYNNYTIYNNNSITPYDNLLEKMANYTLSKSTALDEQEKVQYFDFLHFLVNINMLMPNNFNSHQLINVIQYLYDDKEMLVHNMIPENIQHFIAYYNPYTDPRFAPMLYSINFNILNGLFGFIDNFIKNHVDIRIKYTLLNSNNKVKNKLMLKLSKELQCIMSA